MPGGIAHKSPGHLPVSGSLSEEQFGQLVALLDDQHQALVALLEPINKVAALLLADREAAKVEPAPPVPDVGEQRSESEHPLG